MSTIYQRHQKHKRFIWLFDEVEVHNDDKRHLGDENEDAVHEITGHFTLSDLFVSYL